VDIFFVLSGFILCHVYSNAFSVRLHASQVYQFMVYRFARIYPIHLITFAIMLLLVAVDKLIVSGSVTLPQRYDPTTIVTTLTLTHAWFFGIQTPNMPAWSISAEWFVYILFPALCIFLYKKKWATALYVGLGLALAATEQIINYSLIHVLSGFLIGMATYRSLPLVRWITACPLTGLCVTVAVVYWAKGSNPRVEIGLLLFATLIATLANPGDFLSRFLSLGVIVYFGEISYSLYMVHWPVRVIVRNGLQMLGVLNNLPPALVVSAYVAGTLIAAVGSYHFLELPGRALLRKAGAASYGRTNYRLSSN
jgi:peptidoglycan/LPS O-acetylase OafA/YrhL